MLLPFQTIYHHWPQSPTICVPSEAAGWVRMDAWLGLVMVTIKVSASLPVLMTSGRSPISSRLFPSHPQALLLLTYIPNSLDPCRCTAPGVVQSSDNATVGDSGTGIPGSTPDEDALCGFSCSLGFCPTKVCVSTGDTITSSPINTTVDVSQKVTLCGELNGQALIDDIFDLINTTCSGTGGCTTNTQATLEGINYAVSDSLLIQTGDLTFTIGAFHWETEQVKEDLIMLAAQAFNASASGKNCNTMGIDFCSAGCGARRRAIGPGGGSGGGSGPPGDCGKFSHCFPIARIAPNNMHSNLFFSMYNRIDYYMHHGQCT
jgi:hypothetical protein